MAVHRRKSSTEMTFDLPQNSKDTPDALRKLAEEHGIATQPLDIVRLIELLGVRVVREPMDDEKSGYLEKRRTGWVIGVNSLHHPRRQQFTLAHELAHYLLHRNEKTEFQDKVFFRDTEINGMERDANRFAGELLMPANEFHSMVKKGTRDLDRLSRHFATSTLAVKVRAKELGYRVANK